jgi:hypothetical protein
MGTSWGRFEISRSETSLTLRAVPAPAAWRRARVAFLAAFALCPVALFAAGAETARLWPWVTFAALGLVAGVTDLVHTFGGRVRETPPYRRVHASLSVEEALPDPGGHRDAPRRPRLIIDGRPLDPGEEHRIVSTRSGNERTGTRYDVSIVVGADVFWLDAFSDRAVATLVVEELSAALGLAPTSVEPRAEELGPPRCALALAATVSLGGVAGAAAWGAMVDFSDRSGPPLLLATVLAAVALGAGRRIGKRAVQSITARAAHEAYGVALPQVRRSRLGDVALAAGAAVALLTAAIAGARSGPQDLPEPKGFCWAPGAPRICMVNDGESRLPEPVGVTCDWDGWTLSVVDPRRGERVVEPKEEYVHHSANEGDKVYCSPPFVFTSHSDLTAFDIERYPTSSMWTAHTGPVSDVVRSDDCVFVHVLDADLGGAWRAYSLSTGKACPSAPEVVSSAMIEDVRREQGRREPPPGQRTVDGVTYMLRESRSPSGLALSALRGDSVLWTTTLPETPIHGFPMAVAGGTVIVAATDLRTGRNLRLIGLDAASGRIRYVHRHVANAKTPVDVAAAGSMVVVWSGRLAGIEPASGRVAWITKE